MNYNNIISNYCNYYEKRKIINDINQPSSENSTDTSDINKNNNNKYNIKNNKDNNQYFKIDFKQIFSNYIINRINLSLENDELINLYLNN